MLQVTQNLKSYSTKLLFCRLTRGLFDEVILRGQSPHKKLIFMYPAWGDSPDGDRNEEQGV